MQVSEDHVPIFCSFPPRLSISQVITRFKGLSARAIFKEHPQVKRQLWGGEFWEDGYFARTVGDKVTAEIIKKYIQHHRDEQTVEPQLELFWSLKSFTLATTPKMRLPCMVEMAVRW